MNKKERARLIFASTDFSIGDLEEPVWQKAEPITVAQYWSGEAAPAGRRFEARLLWTDGYFYVRFDADQAEPLVVNDEPSCDTKTLGLWDRDVVEIFIAPDGNEPRRYFEFEAAPNGEWVDLAIDFTSGERVADTEYRSEMESAARIEESRVITAIKIPWTAFGNRPEPSDIWLGNLFRCVGRDPNRGYLAWSPTFTESPNFHVPERFGEFEFVG